MYLWQTDEKVWVAMNGARLRPDDDAVAHGAAVKSYLCRREMSGAEEYRYRQHVAAFLDLNNGLVWLGLLDEAPYDEDDGLVVP